METINDLYHEFVADCGTEAPTRTCDEVQRQFHAVGGRNYRDHGPAFLVAAFDDGHGEIGAWPWGGEWTGASPIIAGLYSEPVHVTAIRNGSVYGHAATHCDEAGCNGDELHLGPLEEWPGVEVGHVYEREGDGCVEEVVAE